GQPLASGDAAGTAILWDLDSGKAAQTIRAHRGPIRALTFAQQGRLLLSAGEDSTVRFWDTATGQMARKLLPAHTAPVDAIAALDAPNARGEIDTTFVTGGQDQSVKFWVLA